MLVKTDFCEVRRATITLQCGLDPKFYIDNDGTRTLDLSVIAKKISKTENKLFSYLTDTIVRVNTVMPVGYDTDEWLVVDISKRKNRHENVVEWERFLAKFAAAIIDQLAPNEKDRIAIIEYKNDRFIVMDGDESDYKESDYVDF